MAGHRVSLTAPAFDSRMSVPEQDHYAGSGEGAENLRRSCSWRLS